MRVTKFVHSCLLVEMPGPNGRVALFDPGSFSPVPVETLMRLDDIFITHHHGDHMDVALIKKLAARFPGVRITAPSQAVEELKGQGIAAGSQPPEGVSFFDSPHEVVRPFFDVDPPQEVGVHYLDTLSHPGDSHSFTETKKVLALPVQAPWGSVRDATALALKLKPDYVIPIHDWHWSDAARKSTYDILEKVLGAQGIHFIKAVNGESFALDLGV